MVSDPTPEPFSNALEDAGQGWLGDEVVASAAPGLYIEESSIAHPSQMGGGVGRCQTALLRQFSDRVFGLQEEFDEPEASGVREGAETFRRGLEGLPLELGWVGCLCHGPIMS